MERGRKRLSPTSTGLDSYFFGVTPSTPPDTEHGRLNHLGVPTPMSISSHPETPFKITISQNADNDGPQSKEEPVEPSGSKMDKLLSGIRRPSLANIPMRKFSTASIRTFTRTQSPSPSMAGARHGSPTPSVLPCVSGGNIWEEIEDCSALSIDYFKSTMKRLTASDRPEPQSCLDFSLLHFINIRHLEHLLYAELKWVNEAMDKTLDHGGTIEEVTQHIEESDHKYPDRLKSIEELLKRYSTAVCNFEEMRKRPVKASYQFTFEKVDETAPPPPPSRNLFSSARQRSGSKTSNPISTTTTTTAAATDDIESSSKPSSLKPTPASPPVARRVSDFDRAATVMRAVNRFGRPIGLAQRRSAKRIRLSHRSIAGVEDWERDFLLQNHSAKTAREEKRRKQAEAFWATTRRFIMAVAGGIALIIPVIIMTLYEGLVQSLVTTSVATLLFAIFVTWYSNANEKDIIAATAAYAAVLVVFVGTSLSTPNSASPTAKDS